MFGSPWVSKAEDIGSREPGDAIRSPGLVEVRKWAI
jgi:hypothetical protein